MNAAAAAEKALGRQHDHIAIEWRHVESDWPGAWQHGASYVRCANACRLQRVAQLRMRSGGSTVRRTDLDETLAEPAGAMDRRRAVGLAAGLLGGVVLGGATADVLAQQTAAAPVAPEDASTIPGLPSGALGIRSPFETPALTPTGVTTGASFSPLQSISGTITPSDLHFQRHHNGIAVIDPRRYRLTIHGIVAPGSYRRMRPTHSSRICWRKTMSYRAPRS
jgi:hypothetical protein